MAEADNNSSIPFDLCYDMQNSIRGYAYIFNIEQFNGISPRTGSTKDKESLQNTFTRLGFLVKNYKDCTAKKISDVLTRARDKDHSKCDCFLCVFLTHGDDGIIYGRDRMPLRLKEEVFDLFRDCTSLIGKPKIFIIQACRGQQADDPVQVGGGAQTSHVMRDRGVKVTAPTEADFLTCYSSSKGYYSIRDKNEGSWFIQELTKVLDEFGNNADFIQMLTVVNRLVSIKTIEAPSDPELVGKKQMPCFLSKLTKQLRLTETDTLSSDWTFSDSESSEEG